MKNGRKTKLRFDTEKNVRSLRLKRFAAAFSCFFILLAGISLLLFLSHYNFNLSAITAPADEQTTTEETTVRPIPQVEGVRNYLLVCTADDGNAVRFAGIVTADMNNKALSIKGLSTASSVSVAGCTGNFEKQLSYGGIAQLVLAAEKLSGIKIDKYVTSTDSDFRSAINYIGGVEIDVEKAIDIRTPDLTAVIGKGKQTMTGDTFLKYIRCFEGQQAKQAEIIAAAIEQKLTPSYLNKADRYYEKIINLTDSDISVVDFSAMKLSFEALLYGKESVTVTVTE